MKKLNFDLHKLATKKVEAAKPQLYKPTIEEVFEAFQDYQNRMLQITRTQSSDWQSQINNRRRVLHAKLKGMGLADMIEWNFSEEK